MYVRSLLGASGDHDIGVGLVLPNGSELRALCLDVLGTKICGHNGEPSTVYRDTCDFRTYKQDASFAFRTRALTYRQPGQDVDVSTCGFPRSASQNGAV